jgi:hypothetical protein
MPNYCLNNINFKGSDFDISALMNLIQSENCGFDFEKISPIPEGLNDGAGDESIYEYCSTNWGTPKVAMNSCMDFEFFDIFESGFFYTAWSPPIPIIVKLGKMFPNVEIDLTYFSPDDMIAGILTVHEDEVNHTEIEDYEEVKEFGEDEFGWEFDDDGDYDESRN